MANHTSAKKAIKQNIKRAAINRSRMSRIRTFIKKLEAMIVASDKKSAMEKFGATQSEIMKGVTKGLLKKNTASRKVKQLALRVKAISA